MFDVVNLLHPLQRPQNYLFGTNPIISSSLTVFKCHSLQQQSALSDLAVEFVISTYLPFFFPHCFLLVSQVNFLLMLISAPKLFIILLFYQANKSSFGLNFPSLKVKVCPLFHCSYFLSDGAQIILKQASCFLFRRVCQMSTHSHSNFPFFLFI